ncbi:MAG: nitrite reductase [Blastocatellia bacterium]|nr:MAG: nitrite reductase [Blastocatellia bacterium]
MQPFNTKPDDGAISPDTSRTIILGEAVNLRPGTCARFELPQGDELAVFNVDGEYYAIENFCPHKGALLSEGCVAGHIVECWWHGWQFDVRTGECLTVREKIRTFEVKVREGMLTIDQAG